MRDEAPEEGGGYREYAPAVVRLLQGPVYDEDKAVWKLLVSNAHLVARYFARIGVELVLDEAEGFAYLSQPGGEEEEGRLRLVRRTPLSFEVSLLLVILREEFEQFDANNADSRNLFLSAKEIRERIGLYFRERADETRLVRELERYVNQVESLGFIREVDTPEAVSHAAQPLDRVYEIRRIVKAKVNNDFLEEFKKSMESYGNGNLV